MTPFYFGAGERRLFGVYHPAAYGSAGRRAAVLCYPWGAEYLYAHRAMRQLAVKLAAAGVNTLRFDYFGTGDSAGDLADADVEGWQADLATAMDEVKDIAATPTVTLIGLRLGGLIAAAAAAEEAGRVDALVLWDPIASGRSYLQQLAVEPLRAEEEAAAFVPAARMAAGLAGLELGSLVDRFPGPALMLITDRAASRTPLPCAAERAAEWVEDAHPWLERSANEGLVPVAAIQRIVKWMS